MENGKLKNEIAKRTRDTTKLIEIEAQKLAVGEMVLERLEEILALLRTAGFKIPTVPKGVAAQVTDSHPVPPNSVIAQAPQSVAASAPIKNPCAICGQEAAFDEDLPGGGKKYYCRPHAQARAREKQEEAQTAALFGGNTGTMFPRPQRPTTAPPPQKMVIQADPPDPLKGPFPNGGQAAGPPRNNVLDE